METYFNLDGVECVIVTNADDSTWSGLQSVHDEIQAQQMEHLTEIPTSDEA